MLAQTQRLLVTCSFCALMTVTTGCGEEVGSKAADSSKSPPTSQQILKAFESQSYDYVALSQEAMHKESDLIVAGTFDQFAEGRSVGADGGSDEWSHTYSNAVFEISHSVKGDVDPGMRVIVELFPSAETLNRELSPGATQAFLYLASTGSTTVDGMDVYRIAFPEGLNIEFGRDEGVVVPFRPDVVAGATVEDLQTRPDLVSEDQRG